MRAETPAEWLTFGGRSVYRRKTVSIGLTAVAVLLSACGYPAERGKRLEERVDRIETDSPSKLDADRAALEQQVKRTDARIADVQKKLNELDAATQQARTERSARQEQLTQELGRLRLMVDAYGRRLDAVEESVAQQRSSGTSDRAVARKSPPSPKRTRAAERQETPAASSSQAAERAPAPAAAPLAAAPPLAADKARYLAFAREQESKGQRTVARDLYEEYVNKFPTDPSTAEAHFRLGELAFRDRRYRDATLEYGKVAKEFPRSDRAPDALLGTAESMLAMNLRDDAMTLFSEVPRRYPGTPAAAKATQRLGEVKTANAAAGK